MHPFEDPRFADDPYVVYDELRECQPVFAVERPGGLEFLLTRHADVDAVLRDQRFSVNRLLAAALSEDFAALPEDLQPAHQVPSMLTVDPPHHTRLRAPLARSFSPQRIAELEPMIEDQVHCLLDRLATPTAPGTSAPEPVDLLAGLAEPLPAIVIATLLGVPPRDHERFRAWTRALLRPLVGGDREAIRTFRRARTGFGAFLQTVVDDHRCAPGDDLLSDLVRAHVADGELSAEELLAACRLLLVAGSETTTHLIATGTGTLLLHPGSWKHLREAPEAIEPAVEELLRFESPFQGVGRVAREDVEIGGVHIPAGSLVSAMLGAANSDPAVFPHPRRLDLTRDPNPHLAFGAGIHFCLGASLARCEARIALRVLAERFPELRLVEPRLRFRRSVLLRGVSTLPVELGPEA